MPKAYLIHATVDKTDEYRELCAAFARKNILFTNWQNRGSVADDDLFVVVSSTFDAGDRSAANYLSESVFPVLGDVKPALIEVALGKKPARLGDEQLARFIVVRQSEPYANVVNPDSDFWRAREIESVVKSFENAPRVQNSDDIYYKLPTLDAKALHYDTKIDAESGKKVVCIKHCPYNPYRLDSFAVPREIEGFPVAELEKDAFRNTSIRRIVLPDSIKTIGDFAFADCAQLESVVLPSNLEKLGAGAFMSCRSLKSATLPESLETIPELCFYACSSLAVARFSAHTIEEYAFYRCESLKKLDLSSALKLGECAFSRCSQLEEASFADSSCGGDSLTVRVSFAEGVFFRDDNLCKVVMPREVDYIGEAAFRLCPNLREITFPASCAYIFKPETRYKYFDPDLELYFK